MTQDAMSAGSGRTTTMKVTVGNRDALSRIAATLGSGTLDDALADVLFVYESMRAVEGLTAGELASWQDEATEWAETGVEVIGE